MIFTYIDMFFDALSNLIGQPEDQIRLITCWIAAIPLGFLNRKIANPQFRYYYALFLGLFISYVCLGSHAAIPLFASLVTYCILYTFKRKSDWISFVFLFSLMTIYNSYRYFTDFYGWKLDGSISLMMMICKLTYMTFRYSEGKIQKMPTFLQFQSYIYFYPSAIMGPVHDYDTFDDYIHLRKQYADKYPVVLRTLKELLYGVIFITILVLYVPIYNQEFYFTDEYRQLSIFHKFAWTMFISPILRCKFLGGWKICQAGIDACGINYNGKDSNGKPQYDKILVMKNTIETQNNPYLKTKAWNSSVQVWLKSVFYNRFTQSYSRTTSLVLVFLISAVWHGIHPAYYFGFFFWGLSILTAKEFYKRKEHFSFINKHVQRAFVEIFGILSFQQIGMIVSLLDMNKVMEIEAHFNYIPIIWPIVLHGLILCLPIPQEYKQYQQEKQRIQQLNITKQNKQQKIFVKNINNKDSSNSDDGDSSTSIEDLNQDTSQLQDYKIKQKIN